MVLPSVMLASLFVSCAPLVAPNTLNAVIQTESSGDPFRIANISDGVSLRFKKIEDAISYAKKLDNAGKRYSAGLMQIYNGNFNFYGVSAETIFDPCTNIKIGADILTKNYLAKKGGNEQENLLKSLSEYYSGNSTRGFKKEAQFNNTSYVERVMKNVYVVPELRVDKPENAKATKEQSVQEKGNQSFVSHSQDWDVFGDYSNE
ncbi:lytic transglycosylase domain-containing protein [Escherichia coli]|nr:lytic transglycosylase domain-containing protein [Escherichia coli]EEZ3576948.1 lytic transglycosylase domain-containing protein [Escherichia coli]EFD8517420.1 lytic transglycosylase domain-containing protein [Escherichia coli]EFD8833545.1 lytic transglycosylase domain-containing protein [Escherichia coli]